jgi:hypothetical protein
MLHRAALDAIIRHSYARGRLALAFAKLQHDSPEIKAWEPVVEHLFRARKSAVRAYQDHIDTYTQKAAQSGV